MASPPAKQRTLVLGSDVNCVPNLPPLLTEVITDGFDFVAVPLVHPRNRRDSGASGISKARSSAFTRSDLLMPSSSWTRSVVGKLSTWFWPAIESVGENGEMSQARRNAEDAFKQELAWASHLSLPAILLPMLPAGRAPNTARLVNQCVQQTPYYQVWVTVPFDDTADAGGADGPPDVTPDGPWARWDRLRTLCDHSPALFVALELGPDLPDDFEAEAARWEAEPVKVLVLPCMSFLTNKKGYPVLSKRHQSVIKRFVKFNVQILVSGKVRHPSGRKVYQQYLRHLYSTVGELTSEDEAEAPYLDFLQAPLQPLMDNLESQTYETFEKDPVKYEQYRKAVALALTDIVHVRKPGALPGKVSPWCKLKPSEPNLASVEAVGPAAPGAAAGADGTGAEDSGDEVYEDLDEAQLLGFDGSGASDSAVTGCTDPNVVEVVLFVVGAGRGPLVRASLKAGAEVGQALKANKAKVTLRLRVVAVEKNPNAVVTLRSLVAAEKWANVKVVSSDMRTMPTPPFRDMADVMVSELLGSFGDNELSPECLDGAQRFLKPGSGISIPVDYTSHLAPLMSNKLWNEARNQRFPAHEGGAAPGQGIKGFETAYVVKVHNGVALAPSQLCFTFEHPNLEWPDAVDNSRYRSLSFSLEAGATVHGLVGYFESRLYGDVFISILPDSPNFSHGMFSWFPLYFPIRLERFSCLGVVLLP